MRIPVGRWGYLPELKGTVIFLASKASDFVTGQTIYFDRGWTV
jgi:NAD(P)-dependent dehydrogenase (short-subunit alcohol dehydrogenase family)